jgi:NitT/TauT family transport system ATP-binding protein
MTTISLKIVSKHFLRPDGITHRVLDGVSLSLNANRFGALIGRNGSGKTTLLNLIAGLLEPDSGEIQTDGFVGKQPKVGYVWQNYRDSLLPWFSAVDNIAFPVRVADGNWEKGRVLATELMDSFLPDVAPTAKPYELSGGQQQMISLLRAVASQPDVLLLDEAFSSLDQHRSWNTALYVEKIWRKNPIPVFFISHDVDEAILLADDIWFLSARDGKIAGHVVNSLPRPRTLDMLTNPEHVRCRNVIIGFFAAENGRESLSTSQDSLEHR